MTSSTLAGIAFGQETQSDEVLFQTPAQAKAFFETPIPEGIGNKKLNRLYQRKDQALQAFSGGDELREAFLREWVKNTNSIEARGVLGGHLIFNSDRPKEGIELLEENIRDLRSKKKIVGVIIETINLIEGYSSLHLNKKAEAAIAQTLADLEFLSKVPDRGALPYWRLITGGRFLRARSGHYWRQGKSKEAIEDIEKSIVLLANAEPFWVTLNNPRRRQVDLNVLLQSNLRLQAYKVREGKFFEAEQALRQAFLIDKKMNRAFESPGLYRAIARLKYQRGDYQDALLNIEKALQLLKERGRSPKSQPVLWFRKELKNILAASLRWDELYSEIKKDDEIIGGDPLLGSIVRQPGTRWLAYFFKNQIPDALKVAQSWLQYGEKTYGKDHPALALRRGAVAVCLSKSNVDMDRERALKLFRKAFNEMSAPEYASPQTNSPHMMWVQKLVLESYIELLLGLPQIDSQAIKAEIFRVASFGSSSSIQKAINEAAARAKIDDPKLAEVLRLDQDAQRELDALYDFISGSDEDARQLPEVMKGLEDRVRVLEDLRRTYQSKIQKDFPDFAQLVSPKPVELDQVQSALSASEAYFSVLPFKKGILSILVSKESISINRSDLDQKDITKEVERLRSTLDVAGYGRQAPEFNFRSSLRLYRALIASHEGDLKGKSQLIISTFGPLAQLPFSVLTDSEWSGKDYVNAPWLMRRFAISYSVSPMAWLSVKAMAVKRAGRLPLLAWGDPLFKASEKSPNEKLSSPTPQIQSASKDKKSSRSITINRNTAVRDLTKPAIDVVVYDSLPPLPETRDEVLALAKVLGADQERDLILGAEATRESVLKASESGQLKEREVVVFATHGLIPGDLPTLNQPALAMSGVSDTSRSPLLTLDDVLSLKLNANWVVLSACNTAAADGKVQEAMSGLARGFFYAGSRSLLVTHWSVESESAKLLTTRTFQAYQSGKGLTRAEALNKARLSVMKEKHFSHPAFWAPYVLVGQGSS